MAVTYSTTIKNARLTLVRDAIDGGSGAGTLEIGTSGFGSVLAILTLSDPSGSVSSGVLTFSAITADSSANATGTAALARIKDSTGTVVVDGLTVGTSGTDVVLNSVSIVTGQEVAMTTATITHG